MWALWACTWAFVNSLARFKRPRQSSFNWCCFQRLHVLAHVDRYYKPYRSMIEAGLPLADTEGRDLSLLARPAA